jgi:fucose 4-O-acetylase-like acetyltransferase
MRISYIDLAKGLCILLVIMVHVNVHETIPGMYAVKVPIFFTISGLFFLKSINTGGVSVK